MLVRCPWELQVLWLWEDTGDGEEAGGDVCSASEVQTQCRFLQAASFL